MNRLEKMKKRLERLSALMEDYEFACTMGKVPQSGFEADFAKRQKRSDVLRMSLDIKRLVFEFNDCRTDEGLPTFELTTNVL